MTEAASEKERAPWIVVEGRAGRRKGGHESCFESAKRETPNACPYPEALESAERGRESLGSFEITHGEGCMGNRGAIHSVNIHHTPNVF